MEYKRTEKEISRFVDYAVESAQLELGTTRKIRGRNVRRVASGDLKKSLFGKQFKVGHSIMVNFGSGMSYGKYIHEGVNGTLVDNNAPFSFRSQRIPIQPVLDWMKKKRIQPRREAVGKTGGRKFKANVTNGKDNVLALAFAIATSIAQKGIVGVPYMAKGVDRSYKRYSPKIADAMVLDAIDNLDI
jgi:hypothetical protein